MNEITQELESIRESIQQENISYGEIIYLQEHTAFIDPSDIELMEWAKDE